MYLSLPNANVVAGIVNAGAAAIIGSAHPVGLVAIPIIAGVVFAKWVYDVYKVTYVLGGTAGYSF